jgi:hypothetical protein
MRTGSVAGRIPGISEMLYGRRVIARAPESSIVTRRRIPPPKPAMRIFLPFRGTLTMLLEVQIHMPIECQGDRGNSVPRMGGSIRKTGLPWIIHRDGKH